MFAQYCFLFREQGHVGRCARQAATRTFHGQRDTAPQRTAGGYANLALATGRRTPMKKVPCEHSTFFARRVTVERAAQQPLTIQQASSVEKASTARTQYRFSRGVTVERPLRSGASRSSSGSSGEKASAVRTHYLAKRSLSNERCAVVPSRSSRGSSGERAGAAEKPERCCSTERASDLQRVAPRASLQLVTAAAGSARPSSPSSRARRHCDGGSRTCGSRESKSSAARARKSSPCRSSLCLPSAAA